MDAGVHRRPFPVCRPVRGSQARVGGKLLFLLWAGAPRSKTRGEKSETAFWKGKFVWISVAAVLLSAGLSVGLTRLNTDPSLLDYIKNGKEPRQDLAYPGEYYFRAGLLPLLGGAEWRRGPGGAAQH